MNKLLLSVVTEKGSQELSRSGPIPSFRFRR
jgi:hypothetical protein